MTQLHIFDAPKGEPSARRLRWYQEEAIGAFSEGRKKYRRQLIVMATGTGKTVVVGQIVRRERGRILILVHRDELVTQMADELTLATGEFVDIEQRGNMASMRSRIVVASVQTITQKKRLLRWRREHFGLVIADEAHRYLAVTFRRVLDYFQADHLGVTATPDRGDERSLKQIFDNVPFVYDIQDAIEDGYLVPVRGERLELQDVNLEKVKITAGDFDEEQLDDLMYDAAEGVAHEHMRLFPGRKSISYWPRVRTAELYCNILNRYNAGSACTVNGKTPVDERRGIIRDFKRGIYQHFVNVDVAVEGFDCPDVSLIVGARPTKSRCRYAQAAGRGTRVLPGIVDHLPGPEQAASRRSAIERSAKPNMVILDAVGNSGRVSLASVEDLLGGNFTPAEIARAKQKTSKGDYDGLAALKRAREELRKLVNGHKAKVQADQWSFDPFGLMGVQSSESKYAIRFGADKITPGQKNLLSKSGIAPQVLDGMPRRRANDLIAEFYRRKRTGLCDFDQLRQLEQYGYTGPKDVEFHQAQAGVDYIVQCMRTGVRPAPHELNRKVLKP